MATVPVMRTWVAGELVTAAYMNANIRDAGNFVRARPMAILRQAAAQSVPNGAWTAILMDTEDLDRDAGHSTSSNTSRYVGKTPGYYMFPYTLPFTATATGARGARIRVNGADSATTGCGRSTTNGTAVDTALCGVGFTYLNGSTDYAELVGYQNSGGALNTAILTEGTPRLQALWISS